MGERQQPEQFLVRDGVIAVDQALHGTAYEARGPAHRQSVGGRDVVDAELLHVDRVVQPGVDAQQHAGRVGRLGEDAVHRVAEGQLEPESDPARPAAHAARQVDEQRMFRVDAHAGLIQLLLEPFRRDRVAQEQMRRVLVIDEIAAGVGLGLAASLLDRDAVVRFVLDHGHAAGAQLVLLPLPRVRRHVDAGLEAELGAHDADRQPEVAGRADRDLVLAKELTRGVARQHLVAVARADQSGLQREVLGMLEHLVDAAARLDRARDRQFVVGLEPELAAHRQAGLIQQQTLHARQRPDARLDQPARRGGLREHLGDIRREAPQARTGLRDLLGPEPDISQRGGGGFHRGVEPGGFAQRDQVADQGVAGAPGC